MSCMMIFSKNHKVNFMRVIDILPIKKQKIIIFSYAVIFFVVFKGKRIEPLSFGLISKIGVASAEPSKGLIFDHRKEPSREDWRYFLKLSPQAQDDIWRSFITKGVNLGDWSWAWRIGWIKACTGNSLKFCETVFAEALGDRALVVRAEAITALGRIYEKTQRRDIVKMISIAAADKRNMRNKKPMFVNKRAIFTLQKIGGQDAFNEAKKIAQADKDLENYFKRIFRQ